MVRKKTIVYFYCFPFFCFLEYYEVLATNLKLASEECVNIIEEAVAEVEEQLETETGRTYIAQLFT